MKPFLIFFLILFMGVKAFSQKPGDKMLITENCNLYESPSILSKATLLTINDTITIIQPEDKNTGFYYVSYKNQNGYVNAIKIVLTKKLENSGYRNTVDKKIKEEKSLEDLMKYYTSLYGKPDDSSLFSTNGYKSRTLVWRCADGKSRSIRLKLEKGAWIKESEYLSDCY